MFTPQSEAIAALYIQRAKLCRRKADVQRCLLRAMEALRQGYYANT